jgi:hypothetical protein
MKKTETEYLNKGNMLKANNEPDKAIIEYLKAREINPDNPQTHYLIGTCFLALNEKETAYSAFLTSVHLCPDYVPSLCELYYLLYYRYDVAGALFYIKRVLKIIPIANFKMIKAIVEYPWFFNDSQEIDKALSALDAALSEWQENKDSILLALPTLCEISYRYGDQTERFRQFGIGYTAGNASNKELTPPPPRQRKRLMIVADSRYTSVWRVILKGIMTHIDRSLFEVVFLPAVSIDWPWIKEAQALSDIYFPHVFTSEKNIIGIIEKMHPDIIFYPEISMADIIYSIATRRLAPLQVASWGHPTTTGIPNIDIFFSGELIEPENSNTHYTERLVKLPGTGALTLTPDPVKAVKYSNPKDIPSFVICQSEMKFDPSDDELYIRIAKRVGRCKFWISIAREKSGAKLRDRLINAFWDGGLDPNYYLVFVPYLVKEKFAGLLDEVDIYLDCPAFSGYTTAHFAIQRGIPIVTLEGDFMRQRLAAGLLRQIGITDTIAASRKEYVDIAARLARESTEQRTERRNVIIKAATLADNNMSVIREFERNLL